MGATMLAKKIRTTILTAVPAEDRTARFLEFRRLTAAPEGRLSGAQLEDCEARLQEQRGLLLDDMESLGRETAALDGEGSHVSNHMADQGTDSAELDLSLGRAGSASEAIREIDEALERIRDGSYGCCEECKKTIPLQRLQALPHARLCVPCKIEEEQA